MHSGQAIDIEVMVRVENEDAAKASCRKALVAKGVPADHVERLCLAEMVRQLVDPGQLPEGLEVVDSSFLVSA